MEKDSSNSYVLFFGPYPPKHFGQSIAFKSIVDQYKGRKLIVDFNKFRISILSTLISVPKVWFYIIFYPVSKVYLTTSRTNFGFIRDFLVIVPASWFKVKIINHLHGVDFKKFFNNSIHKRLIKRTYNKIDISIVLLDAMKDQFSDFPNMKVEVISNSASIELEQYLLKKKYDSKIRVLYLSNLMRSKGVLELLEASKILLQNNENIEFHFAGDFMSDSNMNQREIKSSFFKLFNELKNSFYDRIVYHGVTIGDKKIKLLEESSIFCLPTYYKMEAFPISILEAMLLENAIITTNHNYLNQLVSSENGEVVSPKNVDELVSAIENLIDNRERLKEIQKENKKLYFKMYSNKNYIEQLSKLIDEY
jgi:glycosyltransferase involved in cell wall biosynthesis